MANGEVNGRKRRYARKYRESLTKGSISGYELKNKAGVVKKNARVKFPDAEEKLFNKFKELRKVGIKVDGNYLKAKMLKYVAIKKDADPKKSKGIQSN